MILNFKKEILTIKTNSNLINDKYLNLRNKLIDLFNASWSRFPVSDDIVLHIKDIYSLECGNIDYSIIKNCDTKKEIKKEIKELLNTAIKLIENYKYSINEQDLQLNIETDIKSVLINDNLIIKLNITGNNNKFYNMYGQYDDYLKFTQSQIQSITVLNNNDIVHKLTDKYLELKHELAYDLADNIIDIDNLSFIGGSRKVTINNSDYDKHKSTVIEMSNINSKVVQILIYCLSKEETDNINTYINTENLIKNANKDNIGILQVYLNENKIDSILTIKLQSILDIYNDIFININKNVGKNVYSKYTKMMTSLKSNNNNLDCDIDLIFYRLVTALINDYINIDLSLKETFKIDLLKDVTSLSEWINILFNDPKIDSIILNTLNKPIKDNDTIISYLISCYDNLTVKFPKLYLLDLIYYIKCTNTDAFMEINYYKNEFNKLKLDQYYTKDEYNVNTINKYNIKALELPPSISGIYHIDYCNDYQKSKLIESIHLGLLFDGLIPILLEPYSLEHELSFFSLNINNNILIFNPPDVTPYTDDNKFKNKIYVINNYLKKIKINVENNIADLETIKMMSNNILQQFNLFKANNLDLSYIMSSIEITNLKTKIEKYTEPETNKEINNNINDAITAVGYRKADDYGYLDFKKNIKFNDIKNNKYSNKLLNISYRLYNIGNKLYNNYNNRIITNIDILLAISIVDYVIIFRNLIKKISISKHNDIIKLVNYIVNIASYFIDYAFANNLDKEKELILNNALYTEIKIGRAHV